MRPELPLWLGGLGEEPADLHAVVGEDPVSAPRLRAGEAVHEAPAPSVATLERPDPAFGTSSPLDQRAEPRPALGWRLGVPCG